MSDLITAAVTVLLSGGIGTGVGALIVGRATASKTTAEARALSAKAPAEVDSVVVQGAEAAVLTMQKALESANARIQDLETDRENDRRRILELEEKVEELRKKVDAAERALGEAREAGTELRAELELFARERNNRT